MLKTITALSILLVLASSRFLPQEDVCQQEKTLWKDCFEVFQNKTVKWQEDRQNELSLFSTPSPANFPGIGNLKISLKCVGEQSCPGIMKLVKFQLETLVFAFEELQSAICLDTDQNSQLTNCIIDVGDLVRNSEYNGEILSCTEDVFQDTECTSDEMKGIMRAANAQHDFIELYFHFKNDLAEKFDEIFDSSKYF